MNINMDYVVLAIGVVTLFIINYGHIWAWLNEMKNHGFKILGIIWKFMIENERDVIENERDVIENEHVSTNRVHLQKGGFLHF